MKKKKYNFNNNKSYFRLYVNSESIGWFIYNKRIHTSLTVSVGQQRLLELMKPTILNDLFQPFYLLLYLLLLSDQSYLNITTLRQQCFYLRAAN